MGVQLNIKDAETVRLARELADDRGVSVTAVIRAALARELLRHEDTKEQEKVELRAILSRTKGHWLPEFDGVELSTHHGELLYDGDGVPR